MCAETVAEDTARVNDLETRHGLLAGLVINACEFLAHWLWLAADWEAAMKALGITATDTPIQILTYTLWGFALGILAVWLYAAIRPRFGPGPRTAIKAAIAVWIPGYLVAMAPPALMGIFPMRLMGMELAVGIVEVLLGTQLGAYIYNEEAGASE